MAITLPGVERLPPGPRREFAEALHVLYDLAGQPSARVVSRAVYKRPRVEIESVSHETVTSMLRGDTVPAWPKVQSVVTVLARMSVRELDLDTELTRVHELWLAARRPAPHAPETPRNGTKPAAPPVGEALRKDPPLAPRVEAETPPIEWILESDRIVGILPDQNVNFTGREILLDTMREHHRAHPNAPLVLYGLGGVGKTQLAREYVHRNAEHYSVVWWVPADPIEEARKSLVSLAERLGVPIRQNAEQTIVGVLSELESRQVRFLLVFDGAEGDSVRRLIPTIGGNVVVTSRDPAWAHDSANSRLEVPDFDRAEAIQFLRKRDPAMTGQHATDLIDRLGRLPLALEQLATLRLASNWSWTELLNRLEEPDRRLLTGGEPAHYSNTVAVNLQLALDQLGHANPVAVLVFELFAWFGSEPVSVSLLRCGAAADVSPELRRALGNSFVLNHVVADINKYGLGRLLPHDQCIEVQPLMRLAVRHTLTIEESARAQRSVQAILTAADLGRPDDVVWDLHKAMAPHVLPSGMIHSRLPTAHRAVYHQVRYRYLLGDYEDARRLGEAAVTAWQPPDFLGPDAEIVLLTKREWANALRALGQYPKARELDADAMARLRASEQYGEDHRYTLDTARSFAADLRIAGEYEQALRLDRSSYQRLSRNHADAEDRIALSWHNMAVSCRLLGDFTEAETIDREEWQRRRESRGPDDRRTRLSFNALAEDLYGLGRFREVLALDSPSLTTVEGVARPGELGLLLAARTMGLAYRRLGAHNRALELLQAHYTECAASFGAEHGFTLAAMMSYANVLREVGMLGVAYSLAVDAIGGYERAFGSVNPLTVAAQVNLAAILRARGERYQALRTDEAALSKLHDTVGDSHPFTVVAWINLATDQALVGARAAARTSREAYELAFQVRGPQHLDALSAAANLTIDDPGAGPTIDAVLADLRRCLGQDHPTIADVAAGIRVECDLEPPSL